MDAFDAGGRQPAGQGVDRGPVGFRVTGQCHHAQGGVPGFVDVQCRLASLWWPCQETFCFAASTWASGAMVTPAAISSLRIRRASSTAPGLSPCSRTVSAWMAMSAAGDRLDAALADHPHGALDDDGGVVDHGAGLAARHQRAVVLVGAVGDADDGHPQAALRRSGGEFTVLRQDDQGGIHARGGVGYGSA